MSRNSEAALVKFSLKAHRFSSPVTIHMAIVEDKVNKANVTFFVFVALLEALSFWASNVAISALYLYDTNTFGGKI